MKMLQSKCGKYYVFDQCSPPIRKEAYWSCYAGYCVSDTIRVPVTIYYITPEVSENLLNWIKSIPLSIFSHPNIIFPTDYIVEEEHVPFSNNIVKHIYIIEDSLPKVSLTELTHGKISNNKEKPLEYVAFYQNNRTAFAKTVAIEILKGLEHLHNKGITIGCVDPDYMLFTEDNRIAINFMGAYHWHRVKQSIYRERILKQKNIFTGIYRKQMFMVAPELLCGDTSDGDLNDCRIDLYSVGIELFRILTGHLPYCDEIDGVVYFDWANLHKKIPLHEIKNKHYRRIIKKATEKDPSKRYQSAVEFLYALEDYKKTYNPWYKKLFSLFSFSR